MLHYGYFEDPSVRPEAMSLEQLEHAQVAYAENIIGKIEDWNHPVLDVGCGMGGLANMISEKTPEVEVLTPNVNQIEYIRHKYPDIRSHPCKFEHFETSVRYGTIINSESLQYINLQEAFAKAGQLLLPGGTWIIKAWL